MSNRYIQFRVSGKVQGVWFRKFTSVAAKHLELKGWVKNEFDGSVSGEAEGTEEHLLTFINKLKSGSKFSKVEDVNVTWLDFANRYNSFKVMY